MYNLEHPKSIERGDILYCDIKCEDIVPSFSIMIEVLKNHPDNGLTEIRPVAGLGDCVMVDSSRLYKIKCK